MILAISFTFTFGNFITILLGTLLGLSWAALYYLAVKRKRIMKHIDPEYKTIPEKNKRIYKNYIDNVFTYHEKAHKNKMNILFGLITIPLKVDYKTLASQYLNLEDVPEDKPLSFYEEIKWLVTSIAKDNYPKSKYPLAELTIDEIFETLNKTVDLVQEVVYSLGIPGIEKVYIKSIVDASVLGEKIISLLKKKWISIPLKIINAAIKISNLINLAYWIKVIGKTATNDSLLSYIYRIIFEIIGKLTAIIYMKNKDVPVESV